jgi:hypothetical protein
MRFPFEAGEAELASNTEAFVDAVFSGLASEFLVMPRGVGFLAYETFSDAYERLKAVSLGFRALDPEAILAAAAQKPVILIVLRSMLGLTPPEWAYLASHQSGVLIPQGAARTLDRVIRNQPDAALRLTGATGQRVRAMVRTACKLLEEGCPDVPADRLHRFDKADTSGGLASLQHMGSLGAPYAMLLYERFLGRPFAGHRDSVSEIVGDGLESAIEETLASAGISYRKTKRAERVPGFDQAPDFIIPDEFDPRVVIEAKLTEDDGTARDKTTRIIRLCQMATDRAKDGRRPYEVIACLAGRGFGVRRQDMQQLILHTKGRVFTARNLGRLVECSGLAVFRTR